MSHQASKSADVCVLPLGFESRCFLPNCWVASGSGRAACLVSMTQRQLTTNWFSYIDTTKSTSCNCTTTYDMRCYQTFDENGDIVDADEWAVNCYDKECEDCLDEAYNMVLDTKATAANVDHNTDDKTKDKKVTIWHRLPCIRHKEVEKELDKDVTHHPSSSSGSRDPSSSSGCKVLRSPFFQNLDKERVHDPTTAYPPTPPLENRKRRYNDCDACDYED